MDSRDLGDAIPRVDQAEGYAGVLARGSEGFGISVADERSQCEHQVDGPAAHAVRKAQDPARVVLLPGDVDEVECVLDPGRRAGARVAAHDHGALASRKLLEGPVVWHWCIASFVLCSIDLVPGRVTKSRLQGLEPRCASETVLVGLKQSDQAGVTLRHPGVYRVLDEVRQDRIVGDLVIEQGLKP